MGITKGDKAEADPGGSVVPKAVPKSGRKWKAESTERTSAMTRKGVLKFMSTTWEEKMQIKDKKDRVKQLEREMIEEKKAKIAEKKRLAEERQKRRAANEFKNSSYQVVRNCSHAYDGYSLLSLFGVGILHFV